MCTVPATKIDRDSGSLNLELALMLMFLALIVVFALSMLGGSIAGVFERAAAFDVAGGEFSATAPALTPQGTDTEVRWEGKKSTGPYDVYYVPEGKVGVFDPSDPDAAGTKLTDTPVSRPLDRTTVTIPGDPGVTTGVVIVVDTGSGPPAMTPPSVVVLPPVPPISDPPVVVSVDPDTTRSGASFKDSFNRVASNGADNTVGNGWGEGEAMAYDMAIRAGDWTPFAKSGAFSANSENWWGTVYQNAGVSYGKNVSQGAYIMALSSYSNNAIGFWGRSNGYSQTRAYVTLDIPNDKVYAGDDTQPGGTTMEGGPPRSGGLAANYDLSPGVWYWLKIVDAKSSGTNNRMDVYIKPVGPTTYGDRFTHLGSVTVASGAGGPNSGLGFHFSLAGMDNLSVGSDTKVYFTGLQEGQTVRYVAGPDMYATQGNYSVTSQDANALWSGMRFGGDAGQINAYRSANSVAGWDVAGTQTVTMPEMGNRLSIDRALVTRQPYNDSSAYMVNAGAQPGYAFSLDSVLPNDYPVSRSVNQVRQEIAGFAGDPTKTHTLLQKVTVRPWYHSYSGQIQLANSQPGGSDWGISYSYTGTGITAFYWEKDIPILARVFASAPAAADGTAAYDLNSTDPFVSQPGYLQVYGANGLAVAGKRFPATGYTGWGDVQGGQSYGF